MPTRRFATIVALLFALLPACSRHQATRLQPETLGATLFAKNCAACHGARGVGGPIGPALTGEHKKKSLAAIVSAIKNPGPPMPKLYPAELSASDVADIAAYLETL